MLSTKFICNVLHVQNIADQAINNGPLGYLGFLCMHKIGLWPFNFSLAFSFLGSYYPLGLAQVGDRKISARLLLLVCFEWPLHSTCESSYQLCVIKYFTRCLCWLRFASIRFKHFSIFKQLFSNLEQLIFSRILR